MNLGSVSFLTSLRRKCGFLTSLRRKCQFLTFVRRKCQFLTPPKAEMSTSDLPKAEMSISDPLRQECQFLTSLRRKCRPLEVSREHSDLQRTGRPAENKIAYGSDFKTAVRVPLSVRGRCLVVRVEI